MGIFTRILKYGLGIIILGSILTGCTIGSIAPPTSTLTPTESKTATSTQRPTFTASPTNLPTYTPAATSTISPPMPEVEEIIIGKDYSYFPGTIDHDQATVEVVDLTEYRDKVLVVETDTEGYTVRLGFYRGKVDLAKWWGDSAPLILETGFEINSTAKIYVYPSDSFISIVYITRPVREKTPENLQITRKFSITEPRFPVDLSHTFVTEYWTFPDSILSELVNPFQFNENMNRAYVAMKELVGKDSYLLDADGHIRLIVQDIPYCGLAGNPIQMDPVCMGADLLNSGNPGWGAVHELGHDFTCQDSYCWGEVDSWEGWANFMAFYAYDNKIFINSEFDNAFWDNVWETSPKQTDIFQGAIVKLSHKYSWDIAKTFFRKYIAADPARDKDDTEKQKQAVRYLAESALEVTGKQDEYEYVVNSLIQKGFPRP